MLSEFPRSSLCWSGVSLSPQARDAIQGLTFLKSIISTAVLQPRRIYLDTSRTHRSDSLAPRVKLPVQFGSVYSVYPSNFLKITLSHRFNLISITITTSTLRVIQINRFINLPTPDGPVLIQSVYLQRSLTKYISILTLFWSKIWNGNEDNLRYCLKIRE